jgi:hypothetical protein
MTLTRPLLMTREFHFNAGPAAIPARASWKLDPNAAYAP